MKAAILERYNQPFTIEEIDTPEPQDKEVLVKLIATGICHTDVSAMQGHIPVPLPIVLGHEGAGIVESVGRGVTKLKPGDHVILHTTPYCGKCKYCHTGRHTLCETADANSFSGNLKDGSQPLRRKNGERLNHFFAQSSFAEYAIVHDVSAVKIREDSPLDILTNLGCGASTGIGAILNTARIDAGSSVAVFGCGNVGLCSIMAAQMAGADVIIGIDILDNKLELAKQLGATHVINSSNNEKPSEEVLQLVDGGVDYAIECVGNSDLIAQAVYSTVRGGKIVVVGALPFGQKIQFDVMALFPKTLMGSVGGSLRPEIDIPRFEQMFLRKKLALDKLVTHTFPFEEINSAFLALEKGDVIKCVLTF